MSVAKRKRVEIREAILHGAIRQFARDGLSGTSTQAIADAAGLSKAQLHYYISSKEELYEEAIYFIVREWKDIFFFASGETEDPAEVIASYISRKIRHALEYPEVSQLYSNEVARGATVLSDYWAELDDSVDAANTLIQSWIDDGLISPVDPLLFQMNMWAVTQHYADYATQACHLLGARESDEIDAEPLIAEATALFLSRVGLEHKESKT